MDCWNRNRTVDCRKADSEEGIQPIVDFTHPAKACRHNQVASDSVRVGKKKTGAEPRLSLQARKFVVYMNSAVAARNQIVAVPPVAGVEFLPVGEIVIDRETPVRLSGGEHAYARSGVIGHSRIV